MIATTLFSGIGAADRALEAEGVAVQRQVEIDPQCRRLLRKHFPSSELLDDVRDIRDCAGADVVVGGFPCQDISLAGKRAGLVGERSGLWREFARIIGASRPRWVVIENVPGLLSSNGGRDLGTILGTLGNLGYGFAYRVLDAQFFGVPQRRRRIFIVGCRGDARRATQVLLESAGGRWNPPARTEATQIASALTRSGLGGGGPDDNLAQAGHLVAAQCHGTNVGPMGTLRAGNGGVTGGVPFLAFHLTQDPISGDVVPPLGAKSTGQGITDGIGVRRLMPIECERLQGFPDDWTEGFSDSVRYRMLGNAIAVPVIRWIVARLVNA